jgi:8-oxo-dGTP pyrophosphatase MutT (NUDIX family)
VTEPALSPHGVPPALLALTEPLLTASALDFSPVPAPPDGGRRSAVLMLFGDDPDGPGFDILLTERAHTLRSHAGQVSFPGGRLDPHEPGPITAALRETFEETGADPAGIRVFGRIADLGILPSRSSVAPILAYWAVPSDVSAVDPAEVARVLRVPLATLADPATRVRVSTPRGWVGPGFVVDDLLVWGFTGGVLAATLRLCGLEAPWEHVPTIRVEDWQSRG